MHDPHSAKPLTPDGLGMAGVGLRHQMTVLRDGWCRVPAPDDGPSGWLTRVSAPDAVDRRCPSQGRRCPITAGRPKSAYHPITPCFVVNYHCLGSDRAMRAGACPRVTTMRRTPQVSRTAPYRTARCLHARHGGFDDGEESKGTVCVTSAFPQRDLLVLIHAMASVPLAASEGVQAAGVFQPPA